MNKQKFLLKLDFQAEEREIKDFLQKYETSIHQFINNQWDMFKQEQLFAMQVKGKQIQLPNGKKGKDYAVPFNINSIGLPDIEAFYFENLPEGISYSAEEDMISGVPTVAGDHKIYLHCTGKQGHKAVKELLLVVIPNPKDLWANIPTPLDIKYYKPDNDKKFLKVTAKEVKMEDAEAEKTKDVESNNGTVSELSRTTVSELSDALSLWSVSLSNPSKCRTIPAVARKDMVAASQRGRSHAIEGKPRDDDFALYFDEKTEWYIMAVADGAGSAKYSRKGSQIACETALEVCKTQLDSIGLSLEEQLKLYWDNKNELRKDAYGLVHQIVGKAAFEAYKNICIEANKEQCKPKDYATTLILSICKKFDFGWFVGAFWVGDGGMGIYHKDKQELKILGEPDGGEFAGQTRFLTMQEIFSDRVRTRFEIVEDFTAIILMTDGVTDPKFETDANLNRIDKWNALWDDLNGVNEDGLKVDFTDDNEQSAEQLLKWLDFWSRGNHDDRTIAILF